MKKSKNGFYSLFLIKLYFCMNIASKANSINVFNKTPILIGFLLLGLPFKVLALTTQPVGINIDEEHEAVLAFFEDLASAPAAIRASDGSSAALSVSSEPFFLPARDVKKHQALDLTEAARSPSSVNATLSAMTLLAKIAAQSLGGPAQAGMAQTLRTYGAELAPSLQPSLSTLGGFMQEEATALDLGDGNGAQALVAAMQGLPRAEGATDAPQPSDQAWMTALEQTEQEIVQSAQDSLGQAAQQSLESWLQAQGASSSTGSTFSFSLPSMGAGPAPADENSSGNLDSGSPGTVPAGQAAQAGGTQGASAGSE